MNHFRLSVLSSYEGEQCRICFSDLAPSHILGQSRSVRCPRLPSDLHSEHHSEHHSVRDARKPKMQRSFQHYGSVDHGHVSKDPSSALKHGRTLVASLSAAIGSIGLGTVIGYTSPAIPDLNADGQAFRLSDWEIAWVTSITAIGAIVGDTIGGYLSDKLGRRLLLLLTGLPFVLGWLSIAASPRLGIGFLYAGRWTTGFCAGVVDIAVPVYLAEISAANVRGFMGSCHELSTNIGLMTVFLMGCFLHWNWLAIGCAVIPTVMLLLMLLMPESPRWLLANGRSDEAAEALRWLRGQGVDVSGEMRCIEDNIRMSSTAVSYSEFVQGSVRKPFVIIAVLMFFQQFSGYGVIPQYMVYIFQTAGSAWDPYVQTAVVGLAGVLANLVAVGVVDWTGRRALLVTSATVMTLSMACLASFFTVKMTAEHVDIDRIGWLPVVSLITYNFGVALGYGPVPFVLAGELFPLRVRGLAVGLAISLLWLFTFLINLSFPGLLSLLGDAGVYWLLAGLCLLGALYPYFAVPETKGKSLEEIEQQFKN